MRRNEVLKAKHANLVSQTIDAPIMVLEFWELGDVFAALFIILVFGVVFYSWGTMLFLLTFFLGVSPVVKRRYPRGIFFHWPHRKLRMDLPGLVNPKSEARRFSD